MSKFDHIERAYSDHSAQGAWSNVRYGLIYTCNAGWLDLGHLNPESDDPLIGAANLWQNIRNDGPVHDTTRHCVQPGPAPFGGPVQPTGCRTYEAQTSGAGALLQSHPVTFRFPNGQTGYLVRYRQQHGPKYAYFGYEGHYLVSHGLTHDQKKAVALAIFMQVSERFEWHQRIGGLNGMITDSGHSEEDFVSNLIGFYIGIGEVSYDEAIRLCHPVSRATAEAIWAENGAVGKNKNHGWSPSLHRTWRSDTEQAACVDDCASQPRRFPQEFQRIQPAIAGQHYIQLGRGDTFRTPF